MYFNCVYNILGHVQKQKIFKMYTIVFSHQKLFIVRYVVYRSYGMEL